MERDFDERRWSLIALRAISCFVHRSLSRRGHSYDSAKSYDERMVTHSASRYFVFSRCFTAARSSDSFPASKLAGIYRPRLPFVHLSWSSVRPISNSQLRALLLFHLCPIYLVVFKGSHGYLILRGASRLDAFSVYPFRTWLPGCAIDMTTGAPAVRPSRSSRTKDSSSQISSARAG